MNVKLEVLNPNVTFAKIFNAPEVEVEVVTMKIMIVLIVLMVKVLIVVLAFASFNCKASPPRK